MLRGMSWCRGGRSGCLRICFGSSGLRKIGMIRGRLLLGGMGLSILDVFCVFYFVLNLLEIVKSLELEGFANWIILICA